MIHLILTNSLSLSLFRRTTGARNSCLRSSGATPRWDIPRSSGAITWKNSRRGQVASFTIPTTPTNLLNPYPFIFQVYDLVLCHPEWTHQKVAGAFSPGKWFIIFFFFLPFFLSSLSPITGDNPTEQPQAPIHPTSSKQHGLIQHWKIKIKKESGNDSNPFIFPNPLEHKFTAGETFPSSLSTGWAAPNIRLMPSSTISGFPIRNGWRERERREKRRGMKWRERKG